MSTLNLSRMSSKPNETRTAHNTPNAAVQGAALAFGKPPTKPKPPMNTHTGDNSAIAAAKRSTTPQPAPLQRQETGNSVHSTYSTVSQGSVSLRGSPSAKPRGAGALGVPFSPGNRSRSPSILAASIAAARHTPVSDNTDAKARNMASQQTSRPNEVLAGPGTVANTRARFSNGSTKPPSAEKDLTPRRSLSRMDRPSSLSSDPTDATSIQPTTNLVKLFEQNKEAPTRSPKPTPKPKPIPGAILTARGPPPAIKSPKPQRNITPQFSTPGSSYEPLQDSAGKVRRPASVGETGRISSEKPRPKPKPAALSGEAPKKAVTKSPRLPPKPKVLVPENKTQVPKEDTASSKIESPAQEKIESDSDDSAAYESAPETTADIKEKPSVPPPRRGGKQVSTEDATNLPAVPPPRRGGKKAPIDNAINLDGPVEAKKPIVPPPRRRSNSEAGRSKPIPQDLQRPLPPTSSSYKRDSIKRLEPHMTGDSLANAMVGAALATSRVPSPAKSPVPPLPRRSEYNNQHLAPLNSVPSRTPSPSKRATHLRPTLRKEPSGSDAESDSGRDMKHKKKRHIRPKHPNKHHEGARKRWRDSITEREKKRYEGVWAANRGLHLTPAAALQQNLHAQPHRLGVPISVASGQEAPALRELQDEVLNLVARDIWARSRLPTAVLEEVWELVDGRGVGRLVREEFVVGMWLIDQALKGRKLPPKVQESVWNSVRGARVKVRVKK